MTPVAAISAAVSGVIRPDASVIARPPTIATASRSIAGGMLSSSTASAPAASADFELREGIDLDLDPNQMPDRGAGAGDRRRDAARGRDVVVLDQHGIVEAEAVVAAPARAHRVFLRRAEPWKGLARIRHTRAEGAHSLDDGGGCGRDPGEMAEKVERGPLGGEDGARRAADAGDRLAGADAAAVGPRNGERDRRIEEAESERGKIEAGDHAGLARDERGLGARRGGDDRVRGEIAGAAEIFGECRAHEGLDQQGGEGGQHAGDHGYFTASIF